MLRALVHAHIKKFSVKNNYFYIRLEKEGSEMDNKLLVCLLYALS